MMMAFLMMSVIVSAQTIADGVKMLNYLKNKTAQDIFQKLYAANGKDPLNVYWYGQSFLANEDVKGAKTIYQKALQEGVNDALIIVGMGHVELLEGADIALAKQKFEQAITMTIETKGKNKGKPSIAILNAIGRANADGGSKVGDPMYGIEKLKQAVSIDATNTDILINMGISYLKLGGDQGGEAVKAYTEAITRDPKNALAMFKIGRIYQSQNNKELFEQYYNNAIVADVTFAPAYFQFYEYYAQRDVNKAKEYIEKYIQYADKDCKTDYFYADYLFRAGKNQESLDKAKAMESGDCKTYYQLPLLYAYNYDRLNDSVQAKAAIEKYFAATPLDKITSADYDIAVKVISRFPGQEQLAVDYLKKAISSDTSINNKAVYMSKAAELMGKAKNFGEQVKWLQEAIKVKGGSMGEADYYKLASTMLNNRDYAATIEIAKQYIAAFPEKPQGHFFHVKASKALDTAAILGTAVQPLLQQNEFLLRDKEKNKKVVFNNYYYLLKYYNDVAKETQKAIDITGKMLELYPDAGGEENTFATQTKAALEKALTAPTKAAPAKPATSKPATPVKTK